MHSSPNRLAVSVTQLGSPKGRPRRTQQRNAATSASVCGWLTSCSQAVGGADRATHSLVPGNVDGPRCHANQVVPATGLVDDAITTARKKGIVDQAGKPDLLPCRGNGFPAIRRRLTHGRVRSGLTHHFSLGFLGFSWKIQDIHMIVRELQCAVLVTTLSESRKTVLQKFEFVRDTKLPL